MSKYALISESALDAALVSGSLAGGALRLDEGEGVYSFDLGGYVTGYRVASEPENPYFALVGMESIKILISEGGDSAEVFRRIARVVKGMRSPPIHLPRQWAEYHYQNLLAFFALSRDLSNTRWIVELDGVKRCARFDELTSDGDEIDLKQFTPTIWPSNIEAAIGALLAEKIVTSKNDIADAFAQEVDLQAIGSASVVSGRTYEQWERHLSSRQRDILSNDIDSSIRIVGPAGSGKTLSLCMRALQVSRHENVIAQGKRILVATHSWAMSERIDGILQTLNAGVVPEEITVFPLLSLLELHAGHIGQRRIEVIGDDSTDGRLKSLDIISSIVSKIDTVNQKGISKWIADALSSSSESRQRLDLVINVYEEISGVLTASGVASDDPESIQRYISSQREDWMPPFTSAVDRVFIVSIYKVFIQNLIDREAITTDQFILDSIRVLETFTWRMRKETDGYDYIFVDELQLFDPQERSALELLGRSKRGVPFVTAEDPSQGVFAALNDRRSSVENQPVYLDTVHRFNKEIFDFINFVYQQFPLNAIPLRIEDKSPHSGERPNLFVCSDDDSAISKMGELIEVLSKASIDGRICIITLGDVDESVFNYIDERGINVTRLTSFDDIEKLSYKRKSIVISPWQFIGGTQFSHVIVLAFGISSQSSQFGKLREKVSVYLSCSRAAQSLDIICTNYIPEVLLSASEAGFLMKNFE